jgi:uncharacterized membrane protein YesL
LPGVFHRDGEQVLQDELWIAYYRSIDLILVNLIWFVFSIPIITAIPALGGLFYATNRMVHEGSGDWRHFWDGFRRCFWLSWRWGVINGVVLGALGLNLWFYGHVETSWIGIVRLIVTGLAVGWIALMFFTFPLLLEQEDQRFIVALRNGGVIFLRWPGTAFGALLLIVIVAVPSTFLFPPAWIFISASFCAYQANRAVFKAIQKTKNTSQD